MTTDFWKLGTCWLKCSDRCPAWVCTHSTNVKHYNALFYTTTNNELISK
jgi:hypothetical protein